MLWDTVTGRRPPNKLHGSGGFEPRSFQFQPTLSNHSKTQSSTFYRILWSFFFKKVNVRTEPYQTWKWNFWSGKLLLFCLFCLICLMLPLSNHDVHLPQYEAAGPGQYCLLPGVVCQMLPPIWACASLCSFHALSWKRWKGTVWKRKCLPRLFCLRLPVPICRGQKVGVLHQSDTWGSCHNLTRADVSMRLRKETSNSVICCTVQTKRWKCRS